MNKQEAYDLAVQALSPYTHSIYEDIKWEAEKGNTKVKINTYELKKELGSERMYMLINILEADGYQVDNFMSGNNGYLGISWGLYSTPINSKSYLT